MTTQEDQQQQLVKETEEISDKINEHINNLDTIIKSLRDTLIQVKAVKKEVKSLEQKLKKSKKKKRSDQSKPNGFAIPVPITKNLAEFLHNNLIKVLKTPIEDDPDSSPKILEKNNDMRERNEKLLGKLQKFEKNKEDWTNLLARTDVTRLITLYVKHFKLQDKDHPKNILLDSQYGKKLESLLSERKDDDGNDMDLTFINLQKFIKHHFFKKPQATVTVS
jgi:hypothetical protein